MLLEVQPFAGGVGRDENPKWMVLRIFVESSLDILARFLAHASMKYGDPVVLSFGSRNGLSELPFQVPFRVSVLREHDDPPWQPGGRGTTSVSLVEGREPWALVFADPAHQLAE